MATNKNTGKDRRSSFSTKTVGEKRPVDIYFDKYAESHQHSTNKLIHWICVPLIVFSLLGLFWAIPFPYLKFLGKYNGFLNWASFLIGFSIYYYYKLSPVLSYLMLLILFGFSYGSMAQGRRPCLVAGMPGYFCIIVGRAIYRAQN
jgi:uncharacterized membrane protein YGL010W